MTMIVCALLIMLTMRIEYLMVLKTFDSSAQVDV